MIVNLKQHEIETALRQYIAQQGININSKSVTVSFTAGRKETGISAELDIEDMEFTTPEATVFIPQISVVEPTDSLINQEIAEAEADTEVKTTSLFG
jgi:hypothetical protein